MLSVSAIVTEVKSNALSILGFLNDGMSRVQNVSANMTDDKLNALNDADSVTDDRSNDY